MEVDTVIFPRFQPTKPIYCFNMLKYSCKGTVRQSLQFEGKWYPHIYCSFWFIRHIFFIYLIGVLLRISQIRWLPALWLDETREHMVGNPRLSGCSLITFLWTVAKEVTMGWSLTHRDRMAETSSGHCTAWYRLALLAKTVLHVFHPNGLKN